MELIIPAMGFRLAMLTVNSRRDWCVFVASVAGLIFLYVLPVAAIKRAPLPDTVSVLVGSLVPSTELASTVVLEPSELITQNPA